MRGNQVSSQVTATAPNHLLPNAAGATFRHYLSSGRRRLWLTLLLSGHILGSCFTPMAAQNFSIFVTVEPLFPLVGTDVTLVPGKSMENFTSCSWYRWDTCKENQILVYQVLLPTIKVEYKDAYTGRESMTQDCALHITNLSASDINYYIIEKNNSVASERGQVFLVVVAHLLSSSCFAVTHAARNTSIEIKQKPDMVAVGQDVTLYPGGTKPILSCKWLRGDKFKYFEIFHYLLFNSSLEYKEAYTGKETIHSDCSLHIRNLSLSDSNFYAVHKKTTKNDTEVGVLALLVRPKVEPESRAALSPIATLGVVVGCFVGLGFFVGLVVYQSARNAESTAFPDTSRSTSHHSETHVVSQQRLSVVDLPPPQEHKDSLSTNLQHQGYRANVHLALEREPVGSSSESILQPNRTLAIQQVLPQNDGNYHGQVSNKMSEGLGFL
ncbi:carcinoembryonic antigen-related cell adhesion molecule 5-like [Sceloporus undulatus]|uniref:carcinoembryonic antigen-related cell adhesion molecule 5-like n=1 Tax=Sceloporus undulatus TaxID=8520 RepID=UPI001C4C4927|nr:carcinoembryonic antigen-related cell adhesion molecule 5-like [Sceloporus undulatus]